METLFNPPTQAQQTVNVKSEMKLLKYITIKKHPLGKLLSFLQLKGNVCLTSTHCFDQLIYFD